MPGESAAGQDVATASTDGTHRRDERSRTSAAAFAQSPRYIDDVELEELRRQPPVAFVVQNSAAKEDETQTATAPAALEATAERKATTSRSWHSPVHVPLSHRKLVQSPAIFREDPPFRPIAPRLPVAAGRAGRRALGGKTRAGGTQKPTKLTPMPNAAVEFRDQLPNSVFVQMLREKNRDLFNRLVDRFAKLKRASVSEKGCDSNNGPNTTDTQVFGVEDAILFFLDAKHKRDVLYFKQKNPGGTKPSETAKLSLGLTSAPVSGGRYLPYDLERAEEMPRSSAGDFFMMTSATLVHYSNNSSDNNISGEVIPLSQWIMESKMFSLLLAGIPLFQKFLVRKVFLGWGRAIRQTIYRDNRKRIARSLPFARQAFASPLLQSCRVFHDIQDIRSLALPSDRPAMDLVEVQEHQKELLTAAETRLIDAKEELLNLMEKMVQSISDDLTPPTNMDELYSAEATSIHSINVKWKSTPITAVRHRKTGIQRQKATAALDMSLVEAYVRMMAYLFTESLYLMIIGCVRHLCSELCAEDKVGAICAAVTIAGDTLELSPSLEQTKYMFLDSLARLIRLVSNFHFTKNAITWSNNRGTGVLTLVADSFTSSDTFSTKFDLQSVLRTDPVFDEATKDLVQELALWFDRAAQQMLSFESLRTIYVEVHSSRNYNSPRDEGQRALPYPNMDLICLTGISGGEVSRYLKNIAHRLGTLDQSHHACLKLQTSWKVGFLEIQCRRSISEILELIFEERNSLNQKLYRLAVEGVTECVGVLQRAAITLEDRPQLIEFFCEQMRQVRLLKDGEKQLNQNIRNVDEVVRALKRFAPPLGSEVAPQYNVMHQFLNKYTSLSQSHAKFAAKVLPNITYQVNSALQKYSSRCQVLLRMYDEFSDMEEEKDMEKNVGTFQDIVRELKAIEKATKLYQEYQKMVGLKVVEVPSLAEAMAKWGEVQDLVTFTLQWLSTINSMENGIFGEQNWEVHAEKVHSFLPVIRELQSRGQAGFAESMLENIHQSVVDYLRKLSLVKEMAQPWVKLHHWKEILKLLNILNYASSIGVLITDGSTVTLGFLRSRDLWKYEIQILGITRKAHHDAMTERKLNAMKARLQDAALPILRIQDAYELDLPRASQLLESFEDDLLTIQSLAQITASGALQLQLVQWRDEVHLCEQVLDKWSIVQRSRTKLSMMFSLPDVQQSVGEASFEFQAIDRKWKGMMYTAKGTSSLSICLREVVTLGFLVGAQESYAKLWLQLGAYLDDQRRYFPRFNFVSDHDLIQLLIYARDPKHLPQMISKCFREIHSLRMAQVRRSAIKTSEVEVESSAKALDDNGKTTHDNLQKDADRLGNHVASANSFYGISIDAICSAEPDVELPIKPLRVQASAQIWMKEFEERVRIAVMEAVSSAMDGSLVALFEDNLESLAKPHTTTLENTTELSCRGTNYWNAHDSAYHSAERNLRTGGTVDRQWKDYPLQVILLCMNILVTHELSPLVRLDRTGAAWQRFWDLFQQKKANLIEFIVHRNSSSREKWIASSMVTLLLNKAQDIQDLYDDQPLSVLNQSVDPELTHTSSDVSVYPYSYAVGDAFSWTKLPRFYYDPFEKRVTVHHLVKTFQYEYSFFGNYSCAVLSPLCKRSLMAMSSALSLEHGVIMHSSSGGGCTRKRTLLKELSAMVGRECISFDFSNGLTHAHFKRILRGVLQSKSLWLSFSGLEMSGMLRIFAQEMIQIVDALRGQQDFLVLDGTSVDILNEELAVIVTCSLDYQSPVHHQIFLRLTSSFVPVYCQSVNPELLVEALLLVNGCKDWKVLSQQLEAFFCLLMNDPVPFTKDFSLSRLPLALSIVRNVTSRLASISWQPTEKCLVTAIWEEVYFKVLPERRVAFLKCIRTVFPHTADLEVNKFGMLALQASIPRDITITSAKANEITNDDSGVLKDTTISYDSDEERQYDELEAVKTKVEAAIAIRQLSVSESYVRKLLELYQVMSRRVMTVVVGRGVCGKSSALDILSAITTQVFFPQDGAPTSSDRHAVLLSTKAIRTIRLYPDAFYLKDIYGEATGGNSTWVDGYFSHFFRQNCLDGSFDYTTSSSDGSSPPNSQRKVSIALSSGGATRTPSSRSLIPASWMIFDGVGDPSTLLEPLRDLMEASPKDTKKMVLPNGDQLQCTHENLRIFCEVESLQQWSPACLSRCGVVYMQTELMLPYTLLIKSWLRQQQSSHNEASLSSVAANPLDSTSEFVAKLLRTHLPTILDVCKRHTFSFLEFSITHVVSNMLQILTPLLVEIAKGIVEEGSEWMDDTRIVVAYAATMSLGMILQPRARAEFHFAVAQIAPRLQQEHPIFLSDPSVTLFDVGLRFREHRSILFLWRGALMQVPGPATRRGTFAYQTESPRRTSAVLRARGRIVTSDDANDSGGVDEFVGDTTALTSPLSVIYVPTAHTISCNAWLKMVASAKANAFVVGESGVGKTLVTENTLLELGQQDRVSATSMQIGPTTTGFDIQRTVENGMTGKLKGAHCPGVGKRALILLLENINLETQDSTILANRPCPAMIRQVIDGKGSFIKATKEYVEFRDLAVWCSFSLSAFGYPKVPTRLLRHFHMIWIPDQSDQVFVQVIPMFVASFRRHYESSFGDLSNTVKRLCQFPIQLFKRSRKSWKPSVAAPHLLFSMGSVLSVFINLMNVSKTRMPTDPTTEFEQLSVHFTFQLLRNRLLDEEDQTLFQSTALRVAKKLKFSPRSLEYLQSPGEILFADCGDSEGITRVTARDVTTMFVAGEERFQWYHKTAAKVNSSNFDSNVEAVRSEDSSQGGFKSVHQLLSVVSRSAANIGRPQNLVTAAHEAVRRSTLAAAALKTDLPDENVAAAVSQCQLKNTLDIYSFLQSGTRHLLLNGSDTADRRSTTMVACGTLSFQFHEISTALQFCEFVEQVKTIVLEAGLKATQTVLYAEFEDLNSEEVALLVYLIRQDDLPPQMYSTADRVKLQALNHQQKVPPTTPQTVSKPVFLHDVSATANKRPATQSSLLPSMLFRENVRRSLYVVLSMGCREKLLEFMTFQPSVYYRFAVKTFPPWQNNSIEAVWNSELHDWTSFHEVLSISDTTCALPAVGARYYLDSEVRSQVRDIMIAVYRVAEDVAGDAFYLSGKLIPSPAIRGRRFGAVTTRFDDMLCVFKVLFAFHQKKLQAESRDLKKALQFLAKKLSQAHLRVSKEETNEALHSGAAQAVRDTTAQLADQEAMEREAKRSFLLDEERCAKIQSEIEVEREGIQRELSKTLPDVHEATEALSQINKYHIVEMKSFTNPPQLVRLAMQAVCVLLGVPPTWSEALRILADIHFLERLREFDKDRIDPILMERVKFYVNHPDFSMENMRRASLASTTLCKWVLALVRYFDATKRMAPTKELLKETERQFHIIEQRVHAEKKKLVEIEVHLAELRIKHAQNLQRASELQRTQETRMRWKSSVTNFGNVIKQWYDITQERQETVDQQRVSLFSDCAIIAMLVIFGGEIRHEEREKLVTRCRQAIPQHFALTSNGPYPDATDGLAMLQHWVLSGEGLTTHLREVAVGMQDEEDEAFATSLFLMNQVQQVCFKIPFLVDPLDRGVLWIKQAYCSLSGSSSPLRTTSNTDATRPFGDNGVGQRTRDGVGAVVVLDAGDPLLIRAIETCLAQSPPSMILIENASEGEESTIEAALELISLLKEKCSCAVYFSARSLENTVFWTPKTWSRFGVIDFTPTRRDLDNHFLTLFCKHHGSSTSVQSDIESLKSRLRAKKLKEEALFRNFTTNLCAANDEDAQNSLSGLSTTAASILSAWISSGTGPQGFYDEESMHRISTQLNDFLVTQRARKQMQQDLWHIHNERREAVQFARRARAFVKVEEGIAKLDPMLHNSLVQTIADISECLAQSPSQPSSQHTPETGVEVQEHLYNFVQQPSSSNGNMLRRLAASGTDQTTTAYLHRRLSGLPTSLWRTYLFALVLFIGDIEREGNENLGPFNVTTTEGVRERILRLCSRRNLDCHHSELSNIVDVVKQSARGFVHHVIEVGLLAAADTMIWSNTGTSHRHLDHELSVAFLKIQHEFLQHLHEDGDPAGFTRSAFREALCDDMADNDNDWKAYFKSSAVHADRANDTAKIRESGDTVSTSSRKNIGIRWPPWIKRNLRLIDQLRVHMCLFDSISLHIIDDMINLHLGDKVISSLLGSPEENGIMRASLDSLMKNANSSTPLLILSNPAEHAVAASSDVRCCARRQGIPAKAVAFVSVSQRKDIQNAGGNWLCRDKLTSSCSINESAVRDATVVAKLKEISMDPGWAIIEGAAESPFPTISNTLRLQLARLNDIKTTHHKFRVWLVEELSNAAGCDRFNTHAQGLALVLTHKLFLEPPQSLRQYHEFFLQEKQEQREAETLNKNPENKPQQHQISARPPPLSRHALSTVTDHQRSGSAERQARAALWLFHSIFRLHARDPRSVAAHCSSSTLPIDLYVSHIELDRVIRLIELHLHQRVVAATATSGVASSLVQSPAPTAAVAEAHEKTLADLAGLVYFGRQWSDVRASQCQELLAWCLHQDTVELHSSEQDASLTSRITETRKKLMTEMIPPRAHLFDEIELDLLPAGLQQQQRARHMSNTLQGLAEICHIPSRLLQNKRARIVAKAATYLLAAQRLLETLTTSFPDKMSLSSGIQQLHKQQRESMIVGWNKRKGSSGMAALINCRSPQVPVSSFQRQQYLPHHLQEQPAAHLTHVELPAMEAYLTFIWSSAEAILSLRADSIELMDPVMITTVKALHRGELPPAWRGDAIRNEGYPTPTHLESWLSWFQQAVAYFHAHQNTIMSPAPAVDDAVWLPALQRPKALLFSFRHRVSIRAGLPFRAISLMAIPNQRSTVQRRPKSPDKASATTTVPNSASDLLGSINLSGLFLSNGEWSLELGTLSEQVSQSNCNSTLSGRFQTLPTLTLHATSRFGSAPEDFTLSSGRSTEIDDPRPLPHQPPVGFYRCPLYVSPDQFAMLESPLAYVYLPVQGEHTAAVMTVQGAALYLLEQRF